MKFWELRNDWTFCCDEVVSTGSAINRSVPCLNISLIIDRKLMEVSGDNNKPDLVLSSVIICDRV